LYYNLAKYPVVKFLIVLLVGFSCTTAFAQVVPTVDSVAPSSGVQGSAVTLTVNGSGFTSTSTVVFSNAEILVKSVRVLSPNSLEATVVLSASPGYYSVMVSGSASSQSFSVLPSLPSAAAELVVSDVAGSTKQSGSSDGLARDARFYAPFGAWADNGHLYLADYVNSTVRNISLTTGAVLTLAGQAGTFDAVDGPASNARFGEPVGIWANNDAVFVTDAYYDTIRRIAIPSGDVTTLAGSPTDVSGSADGAGSLARFRSPAGIWGDGTTLYVCDSLNFTIRKITIATGDVTTMAGTAQIRGDQDGTGPVAQFRAPTAIWGTTVYLYVADGNAIRRITIASGSVQTVAGNTSASGYVDGAGRDARFSFIGGIWGDGTNLFIADSGNDVIRKMDLKTGYVSTVAGLTAATGNGNGTGSMSRFDDPSGIAGDGTALYIVDSMNFSIRKGMAPASTQPDGSTLFVLAGQSGVSRVTSGSAPSVQVGHSTIHRVSGDGVPSGVAIIGLRQNNTLVSEAAFPPSPLIRAGRIAVEVSGAVNTGLAIANPNTDAVMLNFYVTDALGVDLYSGQAQIPGSGQIIAYLDQPPFSPAQGSGVNLQKARTFTFTAASPIGMAAVRGLTNERGEFLMTALPVASLDSANPMPVMLPVFADGGGWTSQVVLVNPTDAVISGRLDFFTPGNQNTNGTLATVRVDGIFGATFNYAIPARSSVRFQTSGEGANVQVGSVHLTPAVGSLSPSSYLVVSFRSQNTTVSEAGVPGLSPSSSFGLYAETAGNFDTGAVDSLQSAFAISNPSSVSKQVSVELTNLDGSSTGLATSITVPGNGQVQEFLNQIPGFSKLPNPFQGIFRINGDNISVIGLRARYNGRHDFLMTTTSPVVDSSASSNDLMFPLLVNGQGYTTQLVLFGGSSGQTSTVTVKVLNQSGQPLGLGLH
jgi:hypothetical protein